MPLEAIAINDFDTPLMRETTHKGELKARIQSLYEDMGDALEKPATQVMQALEQAFANGKDNTNNKGINKADGDKLYVGMFNDKPICVVACFCTDEATQKQLKYLAMHAQNQNRGIEPQFIRQVYQAELASGATKISCTDNAQISQILADLDKN